VAVVGTAVACVAAAVGVGLRLPSFGLLDGPRKARSLDYSSVRGYGGYAPLRDAYIARVLGTRGVDASEERIARARAAGGDTPSGPRARTVLAHPFTNDDFANAITITSVPFTALTDTRRASRQAGEPEGCGVVTNGTVWYRYTPKADVSLFADTFGTSYADALAVYTGSALDHLTAVACNTSPAGNAQLGFRARGGETYYVQVSGTLGGGDLVFSLGPAGATERVSVSSRGEESNGAANPPYLSADGRYAVFYARGTKLAGGCGGDDCAGIYVRDRQAGTTAPVAVVPRHVGRSTGNSGGTIFNEPDLWGPDISDNGRYVVFHTNSPAFVPDDGNGDYDVFLYDRVNGKYTRVSVAADGRDAHAPLADPNRAPYAAGQTNFPGASWGSVSSDGTYVAFTSSATDLTGAPGDGQKQVYVRDMTTGRTERVSYGTEGQPLAAAETEWGQAISGDGRFVIFMGWTNPQIGYTHTQADEIAQVYVYDRATHRSTLVSRNTRGDLGNADSYSPVMAADGSRVAFASEASNLVPGDTNGAACPRTGLDACVDYFAFDLRTGRLTRVSVNSSGEEQKVVNEGGGAALSGGFTSVPSISGDGHLVTFPSLADNLVPGDTNSKLDVFVHDLTTGATHRVSTTSTGEEGNDNSWDTAISADGSVVAFISAATNFSAHDTNNVEDAFVHELE
jgi:Tol biopolymer transport system component